MTKTIAAESTFFGLLSLGALFGNLFGMLLGWGFAFDSSASLQERGLGLLLLSPTVAVLLLVLRRLLPFRRRFLHWLGVSSSLLLLLSLVYFWLCQYGSLAILLIAVCYVGVWWHLAASTPALFPLRSS